MRHHHIVMSVYAEKGRWEEAVAVLDAVHEPVRRTYVLAATAAVRAGRPDVAIKMTARMATAGLTLDSAFVARLLHACTVSHDVEQVMIPTAPFRLLRPSLRGEQPVFV